MAAARKRPASTATSSAPPSSKKSRPRSKVRASRCIKKARESGLFLFLGYNDLLSVVVRFIHWWQGNAHKSLIRSEEEGGVGLCTVIRTRLSLHVVVSSRH